MGLRDKDDFSNDECIVRIIERGPDYSVIRLEGLPGWPTWTRRYTKQQFLRALERCLNEGSL